MLDLVTVGDDVEVSERLVVPVGEPDRVGVTVTEGDRVALRLEVVDTVALFEGDVELD